MTIDGAGGTIAYKWHAENVVALVITGKGSACILDQHKINTIIKISYTKINLELIKWVSIHDLKQFTVLEFTTFSGRLFQSFTILL